jgi:hypothetical protein
LSLKQPTHSHSIHIQRIDGFAAIDGIWKFQNRRNYSKMNTILSNFSTMQVTLVIVSLFARGILAQNIVFQLNRTLQLLDDRINHLIARVDLITEDRSIVNKACQAGFFYSTDGARCYKPILEELNWEEARSRCSAEAPGAHLVMVTDAGKNMAVVKITQWVKRLYPKEYTFTCRTNFWTAGRQPNDCNAQYVWQRYPNVSIPMVYRNWLWREPTCYTYRNGEVTEVEHCIHYGFEEMNIRAWNDALCSERMCAICEHS